MIERPRGNAGEFESLIADWRSELRDPEMLLAFLTVLTLPLEFTKEWFPVQWLEISRIGMVALVGLVLIRHGRSAITALPRLPLLGVGVVLLVEFGSALLTGWPDGIHDAVGVLLYAGFMIALASVARTRPRLTLLVGALLLGTVVVAIIGIAEQIWGFYIWRSTDLDVLGRRNATFRDPNIMARVLTLGMLAAVGFLATFRRFGRRVDWALFASVIIIAFGQVTTQSRSGLAISILVAVAAVALLWRLRRTTAILGLVYVVSVGAALLILPTIFQRTNGIINNSPAEVVVPPEHVPELTSAARTILSFLPIDATRGYLIQAGVAMFSDHPLLGVGVGGVAPMMRGPYSDYIAKDYRSADPTILMHTELVRILAETGLAGLAAFTLLGFALLRLVLTRLRTADADARGWTIAASLGLIAIVFSSQLVGRFYSEPYLWVFMALLLGAGISSQVRTAAAREALPDRTHAGLNDKGQI